MEAMVYDVVLDLVTFWVVCLHAVMCPYTKVEESFNTQAVHDILAFGITPDGLEEYDHFSFPGVVPRTFVGPLSLSLVMKPLQLIWFSDQYQLLLMRIVLGGMSVFCLGRFRRSFFSKLAPPEKYIQWSSVFTALTCVQFHIPFYLSRPLANTFALCLTNLALAEWMRDRSGTCVTLLAVTCAIFRADCLLFAGPLLLIKLVFGRFSWGNVIFWGIISSILSVCVTVFIDSYFWNEFLMWPEFQVLWYNTVLNKSSNWGTEPFHWYFTSALPRSLLGAYLLVPLSVFQNPITVNRILRNFSRIRNILQVDPRKLMILFPALVFVGLYSILPHKELRFIFPALPVFNALASLTLSEYIFPISSTHKRKINSDPSNGYIEYILSLLALLLTLGITILISQASANNYFGGTALAKTHDVFGCPNGSRGGKALIHIGNLAAISGVSRFSENNECYEYSKEEGLTKHSDYGKFDIILSEDANFSLRGFRLAFVETGFSRIDFRSLKVLLEPKVYVYARLSILHVAHLRGKLSQKLHEDY
ncbi:hypothetical protein AAMO2058_001454900 [Amorphochlora amoebiformis]